jgi:hypothetical protein
MNVTPELLILSISRIIPDGQGMIINSRVCLVQFINTLYLIYEQSEQPSIDWLAEQPLTSQSVTYLSLCILCDWKDPAEHDVPSK